MSKLSSFDENSLLLKENDKIGVKQKLNVFENSCKIITPTPKSQFSQMIMKRKVQIRENYLRMTSKLHNIVNENKFQYFIRICIILNSLRYKI